MCVCLSVFAYFIPDAVVSRYLSQVLPEPGKLANAVVFRNLTKDKMPAPGRGHAALSSSSAFWCDDEDDDNDNEDDDDKDFFGLRCDNWYADLSIKNEL